MKVEINARHFNLTEALKGHVERKLGTLERFYNGIEDIHTILEVTAGTNHVHIQLRGGHIKLDARAESHDMYAAFDSAVDSLEGQMRKFKDRHHSHPHRNGSRKENGGAPHSSTYFVPAEESDFGEGILLDDEIELPSFRTREAVMEFELGSVDHLVFHNTETDRLSVVYLSSGGGSQVVELVEATG